MRVYHFVNKEYGLEDIQRKRLKIATLNELNDPFEFFGIDFSESSVRSSFRIMKDELAQKRGLLCFSKSWHNPVLWSHYADRHKGLCLGFDVPDDCLGQVVYSRKRLVADIEKLKYPREMSESLATRFLFTKYHHWKYENEVRLFVTLEGKDKDKQLYFASFSNKLLLKEVIVGALSDVSRNDLADALGDLSNQVRAFKTRLAFRTFKVVKQKKDELWV